MDPVNRVESLLETTTIALLNGSAGIVSSVSDNPAVTEAVKTASTLILGREGHQYAQALKDAHIPSNHVGIQDTRAFKIGKDVGYVFQAFAAAGAATYLTTYITKIFF